MTQNDTKIIDRTAAHRWEVIFEQGTDAILILDDEGRCLKANPAAQKLFQPVSDQLQGCTLETLVDSYIQSGKLWPTLLQGQQDQGNFYLRGLFKSAAYLEYSFIADWESHEHILILRQRSERRKQAKNDWLLSRRRYENLINSIDSVVWEFDWQQQTFIFVSQQAERILGYPLSQWYTEPQFWENHIHPDDRAETIRHCVQATQAHRRHDFEYRMIAADGRVVWLRDIVNVVVENDTPVKLQGLMIDISDAKQLENNLRRYERIVSATPDGISLVGRDYIYKIINQTYLDWNERSHEEIVGHSVADLLGEEVFKHQIKPLFDRALAGEVIYYEDWFNFPKLGRQYIGVTYAPYLNTHNIIEGIVATGRNLTNLKRAEIALQQQAEQDALLTNITNHIRESLNLQQILDTAVIDVRQYLQVDRVLIYRLDESRQGVVIAESIRSPQWSILGREIIDNCLYSKRYLNNYGHVPTHSLNNIEQADIAECYREMLRSVDIKANLVVPLIDNQTLWGLLAAQHCTNTRQWQTEEIDFLRRFSDQLAIAIQQSELYTRLEAANQQLRHLANHDQLTAIANRRHFDEYLDHEWRRLIRQRSPLSLILCDVDFFKDYNDTYGHPTGDRGLIQIAQVLKRATQRPTDLAARYGGEEFALILPETDLEGAIQVIRMIQHGLRQLNLVHKASPIAEYITLSFGVVSDYPTPQLSPQTLIDRADIALYQAKEQGRNRYKIAPSMELGSASIDFL